MIFGTNPVYLYGEIFNDKFMTPDKIYKFKNEFSFISELCPAKLIDGEISIFFKGPVFNSYVESLEENVTVLKSYDSKTTICKSRLDFNKIYTFCIVKETETLREVELFNFEKDIFPGSKFVGEISISESKTYFKSKKCQGEIVLQNNIIKENPEALLYKIENGKYFFVEINNPIERCKVKVVKDLKSNKIVENGHIKGLLRNCHSKETEINVYAEKVRLGRYIFVEDLIEGQKYTVNLLEKKGKVAIVSYKCFTGKCYDEKISKVMKGTVYDIKGNTFKFKNAAAEKADIKSGNCEDKDLMIEKEADIIKFGNNDGKKIDDLIKDHIDNQQKEINDNNDNQQKEINDNNDNQQKEVNDNNDNQQKEVKDNNGNNSIKASDEKNFLINQNFKSLKSTKLERITGNKTEDYAIVKRSHDYEDVVITKHLKIESETEIQGDQFKAIAFIKKIMETDKNIMPLFNKYLYLLDKKDYFCVFYLKYLLENDLFSISELKRLFKITTNVFFKLAIEEFNDERILESIYSKYKTKTCFIKLLENSKNPITFIKNHIGDFPDAVIDFAYKNLKNPREIAELVINSKYEPWIVYLEHETGNYKRGLFRRVITQNFKKDKMKKIFEMWLNFEKSVSGNVNEVKEEAEKYIKQSKLK